MAPAPGPASAEAQALGRRFIMQQRVFAFGDDFVIRDEQNQPAFIVDGKALRIRDSLKFKDLQGNVLYRLQERMIRIRESMDIYRGDTGQVAAKVHNAVFDPMRERFQIEIPGGQDMMAMGKIIWAEYTISRGGQPVARISKRFSWISRDQYVVDVAAGEDAMLMLAVTVCIDMMVHEGR